MMDTVRITAPDYAQIDQSREYRCMRLSAAELASSLSKVNKALEGGDVQMLQVNCREHRDVSALASTRNAEVVHLVSDRPVSLPRPDSKIEGLKALYCRATSFQCGSFPDIQYLQISGIDFSKSDFRGADGLKRIFAANFKSDDEASQLSEAENLEDVDLFRSKTLKRLDAISELKSLRRLSLARMDSVRSLGPISRLTGLEILALEKMKVIESYCPLGRLARLKRLLITDCAPIDDLGDLQTATLEVFGVHGTSFLPKLEER